ncbi:type-F conjugative transfer system secretin TraK [Vibrio sp. 1733]|uniref:TraK domain-containing protein n=1 Tax=Vibrio TaxID=662 RepID=UPI00111C993C|nr:MULTISPECIES: type-F conjugative transfer system secretin TraK [Vibrio]EJS2611607.1 type-F conjugative transfer system secretin TraK [Vibrio alginolyticus]EJM7154749.1 type-F conjugative transfer system secretin TraK [Vibrio parahaemolyticus]MCF7456195.1 type-F conjugative transfer system secretin TraK [Vibrio sp. A1-1]MDW1968029.1 type-F conjugative transfer system secretin TraK [Vibrio sp. Vb0587]MDW2188963.1 type-F conjugative transfer system secretin TraK [Vibrio sp. 1733]
MMTSIKKVSLLLAVCGASSLASATDMAKFNSNSTAAQQATSSENKEQGLYVISNRHPNRIVTPFKKPSLKIDKSEGITHSVRGNVVYLATKLNTNIGGFITESGDESAAIDVVFKPMPVPPQEVVLKGGIKGGSEIARRFERSSPRTESIVSIMSGIATGNLPAGYQVENVNASYLPKCQQLELSFDFYNGQFVSGGDYVVSIGTVVNKSSRPVKFKENLCYEEGVVAVVAYPTYQLMPKQKSEVLVMYHRVKVPAKAERKRQSLLGGSQ